MMICAPSASSCVAAAAAFSGWPAVSRGSSSRRSSARSNSASWAASNRARPIPALGPLSGARKPMRITSAPPGGTRPGAASGGRGWVSMPSAGMAGRGSCGAGMPTGGTLAWPAPVWGGAPGPGATRCGAPPNRPGRPPRVAGPLWQAASRMPRRSSEATLVDVNRAALWYLQIPMPMSDPIQPSRSPPPVSLATGVDAAQFTPGLYLVATPIGNSADITLRALALLQRADLVACEDSRVTGPFLKRYGIQATLLPYHEHNAAKVRPQLLGRLAGGAVVALVSDAGTPLINDPGYKLVRDCIAQGIHVTALPGPSAVLTALSLSGLPSDRFLYAGFPPSRAAARDSWLAELKAVRASLVLLESPQRLADSLAAMADILGGAREAAVAREL